MSIDFEEAIASGLIGKLENFHDSDLEAADYNAEERKLDLIFEFVPYESGHATVSLNFMGVEVEEKVGTNDEFLSHSVVEFRCEGKSIQIYTGFGSRKYAYETGTLEILEQSHGGHSNP